MTGPVRLDVSVTVSMFILAKLSPESWGSVFKAAVDDAVATLQRADARKIRITDVDTGMTTGDIKFRMAGER